MSVNCLGGNVVVRHFPFAYNTPSILTGAALYTPTIGDILLDAWIEIDTAWDGTTPQGDFAMLPTAGIGQFSDTFLGPVNMASADRAFQDGGLLMGNLFSGLRDYAVLDQVLNVLSAPSVTNPAPTSFVFQSSGSSAPTLPNPTGDRVLPCKFISANPVLVWVSQDGKNIVTSAVVSADSAPALPLTIVAAVNDTFIFTGGGGGGSPETFTIAPGTYTTVAALAAAMAAATGSLSDTFGQYVTAAPDLAGTKILLTMVVAGPGGNGNTITEGDGGAAACGFTANPDTFINGSGGDPGSSQGAAILYLVTATPV